MIFVAFPPEAATTPADVKVLSQKLDDLIQKHVSTVTAPQSSGDDNIAISISFLLLVIRTLTEVQRNFIEPSILVRILQRLQRDMGSSAGSHLRQVSSFFFCFCFLCFHSHSLVSRVSKWKKYYVCLISCPKGYRSMCIFRNQQRVYISAGEGARYYGL